MLSQWTDWPGKSAVVASGPEHPAAAHMLDVAAVAERLIGSFDFPAPLRDALIILVGFHDIGKISETFRAMLRDGAKQSGFRHWELSEALLYVEDARIAARLSGTPRVRQMLYAAVAGHHGRPPSQDFGSVPLDRQPRDLRTALKCIGKGRDVAIKLIDVFCDLFPEASLDGLTLADATTLSWWLSGFCTAADWIGSNPRWFSPKIPELSLDAYFEEARLIALQAVAEAGIAGTVPREAHLFDFTLRPMQAACRDIALPDGPTLAIIEDETGAGKTEAALLLAHRMCLAGKGRGLFFALPTMATADAMFNRASKVVGRMFSNPSVTLAHGKSGLSVPFRDLVQNTGGAGGNASKPVSPKLTASEITSSDWLAQSNQRALLADIGIGTIDQALLSVLPVRFQTLRNFGLSSKILIVDEVHEMGEPYIAEELIALLKMHRATGGSAILLTATLPLALRNRLLATYDDAPVRPDSTPDDADNASDNSASDNSASDNYVYPALTIARGGSVTEFAAEDRPTKGAVTVKRVEEADAVSLLVEKAEQGAACVWVRNAVDDAIDAVEALRAHGVDAVLLHARFALCDRKRIEAEVLRRAGKSATGDERRGFVLVGTQVLESSLDLDFDVMVSDIAPIAALIQRAGRLWRHMDVRPASERPVPQPVLHVLSPDPEQVEDARWLHNTLNKGAWVYASSDIWRSARVLFSREVTHGHKDTHNTAYRLGIPGEQRALIEAVYGENAEPLPEALLGAEEKTARKSGSDRSRAWHNIVNFSDGYRMAGRGNDDEDYPTRIGEETRTLCLVRRMPQGLAPWAEVEGGLRDDQGLQALGSQGLQALSEVSVHRRKIDALSLPDQMSPDIALFTKDWPRWKRAQVRVLPVDVDRHGCICDGLRYDATRGLIFA